MFGMTATAVEKLLKILKSQFNYDNEWKKKLKRSSQ